MWKRLLSTQGSNAKNNMLIKGKPMNAFRMNQYVIGCTQTNHAAIIDSGCVSSDEVQWVQKWITDNNMTVTHLLQTHAHVDHIVGLPQMRRIFPDVPIFMHDLEMRNYTEAEEHAKGYGFDFPESVPTDNITNIANVNEIQVGKLNIKILHTPGHAPGHVCFYIEKENIMFCGDLIFRGSIGRTDLRYSSPPDMQKSLQLIFTETPQDVVLLSGHGQPTTIGDELQSNPYAEEFAGRSQ